MFDLSITESVKSQGYEVFAGVDEAGRGPLAGPVCAAAVILPEGFIPDGLDDSKKLSEKMREKLYDVITENALSFGIAFASVEEIESLNILGATMLAMNRALELLEPAPQIALIDGNRNAGILYESKCIVKGDSLVPSISAASILAKVTRDRYMKDMDEKYPGYGFAAHKGYGTKAHYAAIRELGPCEIHRPSFLRKMH